MGSTTVELTITQAMLDAAKRAGACSNRIQQYRAGMSIYEATVSDIVWAEHNDIIPAGTWVYGYGYGDGYGYGYGHGYGDGYGYGHGHGD